MGTRHHTVAGARLSAQRRSASPSAALAMKPVPEFPAVRCAGSRVYAVDVDPPEGFWFPGIFDQVAGRECG